jgi:hypothetical protein
VVLPSFQWHEYAPGNVFLLVFLVVVQLLDGHVQGTPEPCFSMRPCAAESLNFSESMFLLLVVNDI